MKIGALKIERSEGTAWQALYIYWRTISIARIGLSPETSKGRLEFFGGIAGGKDCTGGRKADFFSWRFNILRAPWRYKAGRIYRVYQRWIARIIHGIDGRHGWKWLRNTPDVPMMMYVGFKNGKAFTHFQIREHAEMALAVDQIDRWESKIISARKFDRLYR